MSPVIWLGLTLESVKLLINFLVNFSFVLLISPRLSVFLHVHLVTVTSVTSLTCGLFCPFPLVYKLRVLSDCVTFVDVSMFCTSNLVCPLLFWFKLLFKLQPVSELIPKPLI